MVAAVITVVSAVEYLARFRGVLTRATSRDAAGNGRARPCPPRRTRLRHRRSGLRRRGARAAPRRRRARTCGRSPGARTRRHAGGRGRRAPCAATSRDRVDAPGRDARLLAVFHVAGVNATCVRDPRPMLHANVEGTGRRRPRGRRGRRRARGAHVLGRDDRRAGGRGRDARTPRTGVVPLALRTLEVPGGAPRAATWAGARHRRGLREPVLRAGARPDRGLGAAAPRHRERPAAGPRRHPRSRSSTSTTAPTGHLLRRDARAAGTALPPERREPSRRARRSAPARGVRTARARARYAPRSAVTGAGAPRRRPG